MLARSAARAAATAELTAEFFIWGCREEVEEMAGMEEEMEEAMEAGTQEPCLEAPCLEEPYQEGRLAVDCSRLGASVTF